MNRLCTVAGCICLVALALLSAAPVQAADEVCPTVAAVKGKSHVTRGGHPLNVAAGLQLVANDVVKVDTGTLTLQWPGGTKALLEAGARVSIQGRTTNLGAGSMWMNVVPDPRARTQYRVRTPRTMGAVEGTQVLFRYDPTTCEWIVQLWRGKVRCLGANGQTCGDVQAGVQHKHPSLLSGGPATGAPPGTADSHPSGTGSSARAGPAGAPRHDPAATNTRFDTRTVPWRAF